MSMSRMLKLSSVAAAAAFVGDVPTIDIGFDIHGLPVKMPLFGIIATDENGTVAALAMGVRLIDTALTYNNEDGIAKAINKSGIPREDVFISTKIPGGLGLAGTIAAHDENLRQLGMSTVELLLTHFPCGFGTQSTSGFSSGLANCSKAARQETWRGLESIYKSGKARAIGVSHYCQKHIEDILEIATVKISVDKEEWHVGIGPDPRGLVSFCRKHGISYQPTMPLCGVCPAASHVELISGALVSSIGKAHNVSGAQVALRWLVQSGSPVTVGTTNPKHLREDMNIFGFALTDKEMKQLGLATSPPSHELNDVCNVNSSTVLV